ncbi:MAG: 50S ribosomal protein L6 [Azospirillaceae bacterium]
MSRIGKHPVVVPDGVDLSIDGETVTAKGKLGELSMTLVDEVAVTYEDGKVSVEPKTEKRHARNMWATTRTQVNNLVQGVSQGFTRNLEIAGVGYRAQVQGKELVLQLGYSHDIRFPIPPGITITCERPTAISIHGANKQEVGQIAAKIRGMRPPEPFKGKGVRYAEEKILRKEGKKK